MEWVRERIETSCGLIGLLNSGNPNVFLEIGYAWAKGIPTILVLKKGQEAPFNVKSQRSIANQLRETAKHEAAQGKKVAAKTAKQSGRLATPQHELTRES
jgi:nucleoside 2-deoxyribosyltransferase